MVNILQFCFVLILFVFHDMRDKKVTITIDNKQDETISIYLL